MTDEPNSNAELIPRNLDQIKVRLSELPPNPMVDQSDADKAAGRFTICDLTMTELAAMLAVRLDLMWTVDRLSAPGAGCGSAVLRVGATADTSEDPVVLQALANLGNYLWFRNQAKNAKAIGEELAQQKHEAECKRYKGLLPQDWQW